MIVKWAVKKYLLRIINKVIGHLAVESIPAKMATLGLWISRLEKILSCFKAISNRLQDGKIDDDEMEDTIGEVNAIVRGW